MKQKRGKGLQDLGDKIKRTNIRIIEIPEGEGKRTESIFKEIMAEIFLNLGIDIDIRSMRIKGLQLG